MKIVSYIISFIIPPKLLRNKALFNIWQARGYHITPNHFYEPVPDTRTLSDDIWEKSSQLVGINLQEMKQIELLSDFSREFSIEYDKFPEMKPNSLYQYYYDNPTFGPVSGEILYCMIRHFKPRKIFEIGSGFSTYVSAQAVLKNREIENLECELIAFEPFPNDMLKMGFPGLTKLIAKPVQEIELSEFSKLKENDILFIDSSHVLNIGSDVQFEYLEILPRLNKGVIVHVHDIFFPKEYPKDWVLKKNRFWNEQYLLQAFLCSNDNFEVMWAGYFMHLRHSNKLATAFSSYKKFRRRSSSFWFRKVK